MSVSLDDISDLMHKSVALGYTFMFSKSGLPYNYNIHCAYMNENLKNKSLRLTYLHDEQKIYRAADLEDGYREFFSVDEAIRYTKEWLES